MLDKETKSKLSLAIGDIKAAVSWDYTDLDIRDLYDAFKGVLITHTFTPLQCDKCICDLAEEVDDSTKEKFEEFD